MGSCRENELHSDINAEHQQAATQIALRVLSVLMKHQSSPFTLVVIQIEINMLKQRSVLVLIVMMALSVCPVSAQQGGDLLPYSTLYGEWKAEIKALDNVVPMLNAQEKRDKKREINTTFTARFRNLAKEHRTDDVWIQCLIWTSVEGIPGAAFDEMFDIFRESAIKAGNMTQLQLLMSEFIKLRSDRIDPALSSISESHRDAGVRGAALYALAARTKWQAELKGDAAGCAKAEKLLERVISEYPDVSTYRGKNLENGTALLEELRSPVAITKKTPAIRGMTIADADFELSKTIEGKVAVISFSGHWCGPCVAMHPVQKEILEKFPPEKVVIIEINSDQPDSLEKVRKRIETDGLDWIVVTDGSEGPVSEQWHVTAWPTYFVVDSHGQIRRRATGNVGRQLVKWVEELLLTSESK